ncbi:MAG TPA: sulfotransferase [Sphingomicrobium sp.]|nr:sulfotransferase [Sphingomicrobium sp.]
MANDPELAETLAAFQRGEIDRARDLAERQLARTPDSPQLQHLLGLIECRAGNLVAGVEKLRSAARAEPDNAAFRIMLVRALIDSGQPQEALAEVPPPGGDNIASLPLWHARAEAADAALDWAASAEAWAMVATARPSDWRAWSNSGNALAALERWADAAQALRRAINLNPRENAIRRNLATALARAGFAGESAAEFRQVVEAEPGDTALRLTFARLLADLGREQESFAQFDEAARRSISGAHATGDGTALIDIVLGPDEGKAVSDEQVEAVRELALLLERTNRMDELSRLLDEAEQRCIVRERLGYPAAAVALRAGQSDEAQRLLSLESPGRDPYRWHWLMSRIADARGDSAIAFAEANAMNRSVARYDHWRASGADFRRRLRSLESEMTEEWAAQLTPLRPGPRRSPAFLVGFPRSGTTLLDTFLMGHPDTRVLEEVHPLGAAQTELGSDAGLPHRPGSQLERARQAFFVELDRHVDRGFTGLVVDKMPLNMLVLPTIHALFPDAKVIFAQRHPCDCVLSCFMQGFVLNEAMACFLDIADAADLYDAAMSLWSRSRDLLDQQVHSLVYEEMIENPERALRPLIEFLGLDWRPELLDHRATAKARGAIITPSYDQVVQPLNRAPSGRWRRYEKQLEPILPVLLPWAERLGY